MDKKVKKVTFNEDVQVRYYELTDEERYMKRFGLKEIKENFTYNKIGQIQDTFMDKFVEGITNFLGALSFVGGNVK